MHAPTLRQLNSFVAAVDTGSLSAAARTLGITQPAASQQVKQLERALATRLLQRGGGAIRPTTAGEAVLVRARQVQAAIDGLLAAAGSFQGGEAGRVRLGTGATACIHLLPPLLARMKQRMPGLEIIIATGNTSDMLGRVLAGALDLALVTVAGRLDRALEARRLVVEPLVAYAPAAMLGDAAFVRPAALSALPLLLYESGGATRGVVDAWFHRAGLAPRPIMELGSVEAIKVLVKSGLGATILPRSALASGDDLPAGMALRPLRPAAARSLAVVLRRDKLRDRGLRVCLEELEKAGNSGPGPPPDPTEEPVAVGQRMGAVTPD
jgi:DNA-binding transcriptional LysR family regulator